MTAVATLEPTQDLQWVQDVINTHPTLAAMRHRLILWDGRVIVEVVGGHCEAHAWGAALHGRILPSAYDSFKVRRQQVLALRVQVLVTEYPEGYPANLLPDWVSS